MVHAEEPGDKGQREHDRRVDSENAVDLGRPTGFGPPIGVEGFAQRATGGIEAMSGTNCDVEDIRESATSSVVDQRRLAAPELIERFSLGEDDSAGDRDVGADFSEVDEKFPDPRRVPGRSVLRHAYRTRRPQRVDGA